MRARKTCRRCKVEKAVDKRNFYRTSARNKDGYMGICRPCHLIESREQKELKREQIRERQRQYDAQPHRVERRAVYRNTPRGREVIRAGWNRWARWKQLERQQESAHDNAG